MQPYFFPYIGYFQLMASVNKFVVYDNIQFTKKGWIQRNRILINGNDNYISLPIKKDSDYLNVNERFLADSFQTERAKLKRQIQGAYAKAPFYKYIYPIIEEIIDFNETNLFDYLFNSLENIRQFLDINVDLEKSSNLNINIEEYKGQDKVLAICNTLKANTYINAIGGIALYDKLEFQRHGINLHFIKSKDIRYAQFNHNFVPSLSIIDVMMFNNKDRVKELLNEYELI